MKNLAHSIEAEALHIGFSACGFVKAEPVNEEMTQVLDNWIKNRFHAEMSYMERNRELRLDPTLLVPGCQTLIVVALNYYPKQRLPREKYQIAYYAYGKDYHLVMKNKLYQLLTRIKTFVPNVEGRAFCDTAPLLERYWAMKAGLGFIGRNRQLIIPNKGSYFFLGVLAINTEIAPLSHPPIDGIFSCGDCGCCLKACPTGALTLEGIDCHRCLSYMTIEHQGPIPEAITQKLGHRIYGCDTCQQVCPHNKSAQPTEENAFDMSSEVAMLNPEEWHQLTPERYKKLFKHSAIERAGYEGLMRNISLQI